MHRFSDSRLVERLHEAFVCLSNDALLQSHMNGGFAYLRRTTTDPSRAKHIFQFASPQSLLAVIKELVAGKIWDPCSGGSSLDYGFLCVACQADGGFSAELYDSAVEMATKIGRTIDDVMYIILTYYTNEVGARKYVTTFSYLPT